MMSRAAQDGAGKGAREYSGSTAAAKGSRREWKREPGGGEESS
jgi:hypothetical protein